MKRKELMSEYTYDRLVTKYLEQHDPLEMNDPNARGGY